MKVTRTGWATAPAIKSAARAVEFVKRESGVTYIALARFCRVSTGTLYKVRRMEPVSATYCRRIIDRLTRLIVKATEEATA